MVKQILLLFIAPMLCYNNINANEPRNLLQKSADINELQSSLRKNENWVPYPSYANRNGWDRLTRDKKSELIKIGEEKLGYVWRVVKASDYIEFERSGSRVIMENPFNDNVTSLAYLMMAELAEGKGRFRDQIINGVWQLCEMSSWVLSAHMSAQKTRRALPDFREEIIDLTSGDVGSLLSWAWYFFHEDWDKVDPVIAAMVSHNIKRRILDPYIARNDFWWQALDERPGRLVNNWNPWCNFNVLTCFLLTEKDNSRKSMAVYKTMRSVDQFINYVNADGACEEGPSYWGHAAGKLYDYLQLLSDATNGKINIFTNPIVRNMGEYISRSYVGDDWVINFADASAKGGGNAGLIYRYGNAVQSLEMKKFAKYLVDNNKEKNYEIHDGRDFYRTLGNVSCYEDLISGGIGNLSKSNFTWYPQTQFCYMKNKEGFFLAAKGGHNNESHNHNDVGTFSFYLNNIPFFIDVGVGTYTKFTFSKERYSIWTMQSNYHNLPLINGAPQVYGSQYRANQVSFDSASSTFKLNIGEAYAKEAMVKKWLRTYTLNSNGLLIKDDFDIKDPKQPSILNFMTWAKPEIKTPGLVVLEKNGQQLNMKYNSQIFDPLVETIQIDDKKLSNVWGDAVYRLSLKAKKIQSKGIYTITINKNK